MVNIKIISIKTTISVEFHTSISVKIENVCLKSKYPYVAKAGNAFFFVSLVLIYITSFDKIYLNIYVLNILYV